MQALPGQARPGLWSRGSWERPPDPKDALHPEGLPGFSLRVSLGEPGAPGMLEPRLPSLPAWNQQAAFPGPPTGTAGPHLAGGRTQARTLLRINVFTKSEPSALATMD